MKITVPAAFTATIATVLFFQNCSAPNYSSSTTPSTAVAQENGSKFLMGTVESGLLDYRVYLPGSDSQSAIIGKYLFTSYDSGILVSDIENNLSLVATLHLSSKVDSLLAVNSSELWVLLAEDYVVGTDGYRKNMRVNVADPKHPFVVSHQSDDALPTTAKNVDLTGATFWGALIPGTYPAPRTGVLTLADGSVEYTVDNTSGNLYRRGVSSGSIETKLIADQETLSGKVVGMHYQGGYVLIRTPKKIIIFHE